MNGVNLNLFQFEFDLTWMSFFMNAKDQTYLRYGGRDDSDAESHLNQKSLVRAMQDALRFHKTDSVQTSRYEPAAKTVSTPEDIPTMQAMIAKRKKNKCIHCHDVKVASLRHSQSLGQFTRAMVHTYPTPANVGIEVHAIHQSQVQKVAADSPAAKAGIQPGDLVLAADGQRILTLADFTRVLELTPASSTLPLQLERDGKPIKTSLKLSGNWRTGPDPSWRESLHVAGPNTGLWGRKLNPSQRKQHGIDGDGLAVEVTFIWGSYTKQAGVRVKDVIISVDGIRRDMTIRQLHAYCMLNKNFGESVPIVVKRGGKDVKLTIRFPDKPQ